MIIYDSKDWFGVIRQREGSALRDVLYPQVLAGCCWAAVAVILVKGMVEQVDKQARVSVPSLQGIAFVAGVMLSMQGQSAYGRYGKAVDLLVKLENQCLELTRHACMVLDVPELGWLRREVRRTLLATIMCAHVDCVARSARGKRARAVGRQCLARAQMAGLLTPDELAEFQARRGTEPSALALHLTSECMRTVGKALLFDQKYDAWREAMRNEASQQPVTNFLKLLDGHFNQVSHSCRHKAFKRKYLFAVAVVAVPASADALPSSLPCRFAP